HTNGLLGKLEIEYNIVSGLTAGVNYQYERQNALNSTLSDEEGYMTRDYINRYTQLKDDGITYIVPKGGILDKGNQTLAANNFRGRINYNNDFGKNRSEEHTSELQSRENLVCRLLLEKKK